MLRTRVIPCLLLRNRGLVKTVEFEKPTYVGDPINAVKIFNEKEVDELIFLDITATVEGRDPPHKAIEEIAGECFMPLCYGGGVRSVEQAQKIYALGAEKVALNSEAAANPRLVTDLAKVVGSQSVVVSIDVRRSVLGGYTVVTRSGSQKQQVDPVTYARRMQDAGAGELLITAIHREGTMKGYDVELLRKITRAVTVPVIANGGAGRTEDFAAAVREGGASAVAAGAMFVFHGKHRAVLINYPTRRELERVLP